MRGRINRKSKAPAIQPKLKVGQPGDKYEQEADAVADRVVSNAPVVEPTVQMEPTKEEEPPVQMQSEEEETVSMKADEEQVAMSPEEEEQVAMKEDEEVSMKEEEEIAAKEDEEVAAKEDEIKKKPAIQKSGDGATYASPAISQQIHQTKGQGTALNERTQQEMGQKIGGDFSGVKIHTDQNAAQLNDALGAKAFTHGNDIYFNKGKYDPGSSKGKHLLAHELTHVVQQGGKERIQKQEERSVNTRRPDNDEFEPYPPNIEEGLQKKEQWAYTAAAKWDLEHDQVSFKAMDKIEGHTNQAFNSHHFVRLTEFYLENAKKEGNVSVGETEEAYKLCSPAMYYAMNKLYNWTGNEKIKSGYVVDHGDTKGIVTLMKEKNLVGDHKRVVAVDEDGKAGHYSDKEVVKLDESVAKWAKDQTAINSIGVFLVSVHGGYHSMTMIVDRRGKGGITYRLLDQHETTGSGFDRTKPHNAKAIDKYFVTMASSWGDINSNHSFDIYELLRD